MARSAGLRVVARPTQEILIAEPERELGTVRHRRLVFPRLREQFDQEVWEKLRLNR